VKEGNLYRQGDVLIIPVNEVPGGLDPVARENGRIVLAHGETTGHVHSIAAEGAALFRDPNLAAAFLTVTGETIVVEHDEHDTIHLPPGSYRIVRQREYRPEEIRDVAD
jgi:hypothetical protein